MKAINWEEVETDTPAGSGNDLPTGGYVMRITDVDDLEDYTNQWGDTYDCIRIRFDVAEGDKAGFFTNNNKPDFTHEYEFRYNPDNCGGNYGWMAGQFKTFYSTVLPESNPGFVFDFNDVACMEGQLFGVTIRQYLYESNGEDKSRPEVQGFYTVDAIREGKFKKPQDRIKRGYTPPSQRNAATTQTAASESAYELPF